MDGGASESSRVVLEEKYFRGLDKFDNTEETWSGWIFNVITQVAGAKVEIATVMERVMEKGVALTKDAVEGVNPDVVRRYGGELFRVLAGLTSGEANTIVRGVATKKGMSGRQNGFWALKLLEHRFNPKTTA